VTPVVVSPRLTLPRWFAGAGRAGEVVVRLHGAAVDVLADDLGVAQRLGDVRVTEQAAGELELHARAQPFGEQVWGKR
jgi:hypothetical protein